MNSINTLAGKGGHKVISGATAYGATDYHFTGFVPHADTTFTKLVAGSDDVTPTGVTYAAGIYYPCSCKVGNGYYTEVTLASGSITLYLTVDSPKHY
jgi:hypothetical protein